MQDLYLPHIGSFNFLVDEGLSLAVQVSFNIFRLNLRSFMWGELIRVYGYKSKRQFATRISRRCHIVTTCGRPTALLHSRVSQNRTQDFSRRKFKHTLTGLYNNFHTRVLLYGSTLFMTLIPQEYGIDAFGARGRWEFCPNFYWGLKWNNLNLTYFKSAWIFLIFPSICPMYAYVW